MLTLAKSIFGKTDLHQTHKILKGNIFPLASPSQSLFGVEIFFDRSFLHSFD